MKRIKTAFMKLHKKYPFLDSIISLLFGSLIGYIFQELMICFRTDTPFSTRLIMILRFAFCLLIISVYYAFCYPPEKKPSTYEAEKERNLITISKRDRELIDAIAKEAIDKINDKELSITEKCHIVEIVHDTSIKITNTLPKEL